MKNPTSQQLQALYIQCHILTNVMFQPIHIIRLDDRTGNLFILAGSQESIGLQITPTGEVISDE
jgi:hypothetical protein